MQSATSNKLKKMSNTTIAEEPTPVALADLVRYKVHCKNVGFMTEAPALKAYFETNYGPVISVSKKKLRSYEKKKVYVFFIVVVFECAIEIHAQHGRH